MSFDISNAIKFLEKDDKFKLVVKQVGYIQFKTTPLNFEQLLKIIINQQLSNHVADVIFLRLKNRISGSEHIEPQKLIDCDNNDLRELGISFSKISFMKDISEKIINSPNLIKSWENLENQEAITEIQKLKGFGPWSANIILLYMGRMDIFPYNDATLQKGYNMIYEKKLSKNLSEINWAKPYRSILARYLWKWVDNGMIPLHN